MMYYPDGRVLITDLLVYVAMWNFVRWAAKLSHSGAAKCSPNGHWPAYYVERGEQLVFEMRTLCI